MLREVHSGLWVGDGESINGPLKAMAGYSPGPFRRTCDGCGAEHLASEHDAPHRCLDCALIEITANLFVIHAAKEPWHRNALGYTERGAPPAHPEYLVAKRPGELMLNLVDMKSISPQYTNPIVEAAFEAIDHSLDAGKKVLLHCNEGKSRAPTLALLWMGEHGYYQDTPFDQAAEAFRNNLYPEYDPGAGMANYARERWGYVEETTEASD